MLQDVFVMDRKKANLYIPPRNSALIAIIETGEAHLPISHLYKKYLPLVFHDVIKSKSNKGSEVTSPKILYFDETLALNVHRFFLEIPRDATLVIHCHAGISRSAAIALSYAWFTNNSKLEAEILYSERYLPNKDVLNQMAKQLNIQKDVEQIYQQMIGNLPHQEIPEFHF